MAVKVERNLMKMDNVFRIILTFVQKNKTAKRISGRPTPRWTRG